MHGIGRQMATGAAWMVALKLVERSIGVVSTVILARLLTPQDFGLVAMAMVFIAAIEILQAFGFDIALIQNRKASREHYDSAWALNLLLACLGTALLVAGAKAASVFYDEPRVQAILYCLAVGAFVQGFENIGIVAFRKELTFNKEFRFQLAKKLLSFVVTVSLAFMYRSYWALVIGAVAGRAFGVLLSYAAHPFRPRFNLVHAKSLIGFSKWMVINNALFVARRRVADVIVGRQFGANGLGQFSMAHEISTLPTTELSAPINRAVFPGYSKLSHDEGALREGFLKVISLILLVTLPTAVGIAVVAKSLVLVMLGDQWEVAGSLIQVLALYGLSSSISSNFGYVFLAKGKPRYITLWAGTMVILEIGFIGLGSRYFGLVGAAIGLLIGAAIPFPFVAGALSRLLGLGTKAWWSVAGRPVMSTTIMVLALKALEWVAVMHWPTLPAYVLLIALVTVGALVYTSCCFALWSRAGKPDGPEKYLKERLLEALGRRVV